jgi:amino acid transporter
MPGDATTGSAGGRNCSRAVLMTSRSAARATGTKRSRTGWTSRTKGMGREAGLGAALLAIVGYTMVYIGSYPLEGTFFQSFLRDTLHGPDIQWWVWMLIMIAAVSAFGYFNLEFSARTLTVCMCLEAIMIIVYNLAVIAQGGVT